MTNTGTSTGVHELLAAAPRAGERVTGEPIEHPRRTFPLRAEVGRQWRRRRTRWTFLLLAVLPVLLVVAFLLGDDDEPSAGAALIDAAQSGGVNFGLLVVYVSCTFLVTVVAAMFGGDTVASEASWSTLRYLLAAPISRGRLLWQKWLVAVVSIAAALGVLYGSAVLVGTLAFGWGPVTTPSGAVIDTAESLQRLGVAVAYVLITSLTVAALAFLLGVWTDAPLGAVGGAVLLMIVSSILDQIEELGVLRQLLPTHYQFAWTDALLPEVLWETMARGAVLSFGYAAVLLAASWFHFLRKDIVS